MPGLPDTTVERRGMLGDGVKITATEEALLDFLVHEKMEPHLLSRAKHTKMVAP